MSLLESFFEANPFEKHRSLAHFPSWCWWWFHSSLLRVRRVVINGKCMLFTCYIDVVDLFLDCSQGINLAAHFGGSRKERLVILTVWLNLGINRENILKQIWFHGPLKFSEITFGRWTWTPRKKFFDVFLYWVFATTEFLHVIYDNDSQALFCKKILWRV